MKARFAPGPFADMSGGRYKWRVFDYARVPSVPVPTTERISFRDADALAGRMNEKWRRKRGSKSNG